VIVGWAGVLVASEHLIAWLKETGGDGHQPKISHISAIIIKPNGRVFMFENGAPQLMAAGGRYHAVGSGANLALGAMFAGADACTAVRAAIYHDTNTGGRVMTLKVDR
jgi:hypothetical protein